MTTTCPTCGIIVYPSEGKSEKCKAKSCPIKIKPVIEKRKRWAVPYRVKKGFKIRFVQK